LAPTLLNFLSSYRSARQPRVASWNVLDPWPIGLRKCLCKVRLICILHPVKSVPRFSPTLPTLTHSLASQNSSPFRPQSHEKGRETYPGRPGFLNVPTPTKHGTRHFIALPFLLPPAGWYIAVLVDPILNVSNPARKTSYRCLS
jgi:hypothetical protein